MSIPESKRKPVHFKIVGSIVIAAYLVPWFIIAALHWSLAGFDLEATDNWSFLLYTAVCACAWVTSFHLWSRVPNLEGKIRKLFLMTGITFVVLVGLFSYLTLNAVLPWMDLPSITVALDAAIPRVEFWIFYVEAWRINMPADSLITFALMVLAVTFYLFPMERYARQQFPWHTLSMFICAALIPLLLWFRNLPDPVIVMSIGTLGVILVVLYNFFFLFYLYFSLGIKAPKGTPLRKAAFMIGFGFLCILLTWVAGWAMKTDIAVLNLVIPMIFGGTGVFLFNYGFHLIRPD